MIGQSVGSDASRLSCFLFRPRKSREKRRKRSHTNVSNTLVTRASKVSQTLLQTPIPYFHQWVPHGKKALVAIACKTAYVCFHRRKWVHLKESHTAAYTPKQGRFGWERYYYPRSVSHVSETLRGQVSERQTLPLLGLGRVCSRRARRACGTAMRLCASLFRRRRGPAGLRDLFAIW